MPAHEHFGQGRLPRTVATDETDTVSPVHAEGHLGHEGPGTGGDFEAGGLNHSVSKLRSMRSARNCWGWMLRARARATSSCATAVGRRREETVVYWASQSVVAAS